MEITNINSVVIVEDDMRIANILSKTINGEAGFEVVGIAQNATEAIDLLDIFKPELIFLDVSLVESNGLDVLKYVRQDLNAADISIVMLTAAKDSEVIQEAMSYGAFDYILKPLAFSRLKLTLARFIQYRQRLSTQQPFEQDDLDELFHNQGKLANPSKSDSVINEIAPLPKGIDSLTLDKIRAVFSDNSGTAYTAESMSEYIGTSRTTARRYLEYLLSCNEIIADIEYGTVGRPERHYLLK
ncbi:response regulator [Colwellia psychrerythraea]|uniref:Transcriptional regulatory protein n=1 Tax=Colwellia psychrerythraea TaxID=28229 RepID=A0A099K6U6_COLPS|nr:response regulator [Colwellia psychrerythraea]KGJ86514.1 response regulator receiver and unknown domain protein [Colwellia psychrerythraea]